MRSDLLPDDTSADPGQYAAGDAPWDHYRVEMEMRLLRTRVEEAEAKSALDQQQCDEMTDTAGRLAERVAELERKLEEADKRSDFATKSIHWMTDRLAAWEPVVRWAESMRGYVATHPAMPPCQEIPPEHRPEAQS